ncbi:hypothetical protein SLH47_24020 [Cognatiyoonia sp. IB215182]|nr:hypothetical protein [Cognatiyoonia sp. IB215182]
MRQTDALALLDGATAAITETEQSAEAIAQALAAAPNDIDVLLAAYRFAFYTHDYSAACRHAQAILSHAARQLNIATDWRDVSCEDADFTAHRFAPGLYLQALIGWGYCLARMGVVQDAAKLLEQAAALDPTDRFGGAWLLDKVLQPQDDDCDDD